MVYCSVPGCEKKNKNQRKRFMFSFPKREELLQKWLEAMPHLVRPVKSSWRVCQHHFEREDILQAFSHTIGGEVYLIERERPRLKPNAVPTKNLQSDKFVPNDKLKNTCLTVAPDSTEKTKNCSIADGRDYKDQNLINDEEQTTGISSGNAHIIRTVDIVLHNNKETNLPAQSEISNNLHKNVEYADVNKGEKRKNIENIEVDKSKTNSNGTEKAGIQERSPSKEGLSENKIVYSPQCSESSALGEPEPFENLFDNVFEVVLPTTLWGVHRSLQQNRIMFVSIHEEHLNINKLLTVNDKGELKIYLAERLIREEQWPLNILTSEELSKMLAELESMQICLGARLSESCEVLLTDIDHNNEQTEALCKKCY